MILLSLAAWYSGLGRNTWGLIRTNKLFIQGKFSLKSRSEDNGKIITSSAGSVGFVEIKPVCLPVNFKCVCVVCVCVCVCVCEGVVVC